MINKKTLLVLIAGTIILATNLIGKQSFESKLKIIETKVDGNVVYDEKSAITFKNGSIQNDIKYKNFINKLFINILENEKKFNGKELYYVDSLKDSSNNLWTVTTTVTNKDESVTHAISKQNQKIIEIWINRNDKDIFGLKIFNF